MDVKAIKLELVQKILDTKEESILERIKQIFEQPASDWWDVIDEEEKKAIEEGLAQLDRGEGVAHEEVVKLSNEKFGNR